MNVMYPNPFIYKRALLPGQDDMITIARPAILAKVISGLEFGHWYSICGGKKIGKTTFLLSLIEECKRTRADYHFVLIKPEELVNYEPATLYRLLCHRLRVLWGDHKNLVVGGHSREPDLEYLRDYLAATATRLQPRSRVIIILDGFETFPKSFAQEAFRAIIHLRQSQQASPGKFQFMVSGIINTADAQFEQGRSISEYTIRELLEDLRYEDMEEMLGRVSRKLGLFCEPGFERLLYEATNGTGYLVQKICYRILERAFMRKERPAFSHTQAESAIDSIIKEGETTFEMLVAQIEREPQLVDGLVRTLRAGSIDSAKYNPQLKTLVAWGALSEYNGVYRVRNRIYETMFQDYFTTERMADFYFEQKKYRRAHELFAETLIQQSDAKHALHALWGNIHAIGAEAGEDKPIRHILEAFMNLVDSTRSCSLMIVDRARGMLHILDALGSGVENLVGFELELGQGVAGWVARVGRARIIRDVTDEMECPDFVDRELANKLNIGAMASLPLKIAGNTIAVINLCLGKPREFNRSEVKILEIMASHASLVLQSLRFELDLKQYQQQVDQVRALVKEAMSQTEVDAIAGKILQLAGDIAGTNKGYLAYRQHAATSWTFRFPEDPQLANLRTPDIEAGEGFAGHVSRTGVPYVSSDPAPDPRYFAMWEGMQWELAVPCLIDEETEGCLVMTCDHVPVFTPLQMHLVGMLADAVAITLRNKRLYGIAEKKTQQVISAHSIGEALSHEDSLQAILNLIADECLNVVGRDGKLSFVWIKDKERGKLILKAMQGEAVGREHLGRSLRLKEPSLVTWVLNHSQSSMVVEARQNVESPFTSFNIKSEIAVPLMFREEAIGVIHLQSFRLNDFDEQDREALTAVAHHAAVAMKIGELCDVRLKELEALYRIGTKINSSLNVKEVIRTICREGLKAIGNENRNLIVELIDPETQISTMRVMRGLNAEIDKPRGRGDSEQSREAWVVKNKNHYLSAEIESDPLYMPTSPFIRSAIFVPIMFNLSAIGLITMESCFPDDFGEVELRFLKGLANQAGVAIENARLSENLAKAEIGLAKALETAAIEETVAGFSHDIKSFLAMIASETQWLEKLERDHSLRLEEVGKAVQNINAYVRTIEDFTHSLKRRAYQQPPELHWRNLRSLIEEATRPIAAKAQRQMVELKQNDSALDLQVFVDPGLLVRAFFNVISNAIDAMPEGGSLQIDAQQDNRQVRISFSDSGTGIPSENLNKVLQPLFTTKEHGYGLGLALTRRIIEIDHGGKLDLHSTPGTGTTVELFLPLDLYASSRAKDNHPSRPSVRTPQVKTSKASNANILVVNDDTQMLNKITQVLGSAGHRVTGAELGKVAVACCKKNDFDAIVLDYHLKKDHHTTQTALDFVPELRKHAPGTPIILTSASLDHLGAPDMYCDFFLEIDHSFWDKIINLIDRYLPATAKMKRTA